MLPLERAHYPWKGYAALAWKGHAMPLKRMWCHLERTHCPQKWQAALAWKGYAMPTALGKDTLSLEGHSALGKNILSLERTYCPWKDLVSLERTHWPLKGHVALRKDMLSLKWTYHPWKGHTSLGKDTVPLERTHCLDTVPLEGCTALTATHGNLTHLQQLSVHALVVVSFMWLSKCVKWKWVLFNAHLAPSQAVTITLTFSSQ